MRYEHKSRDGQPFIVYALVCPRTKQVKYVGQTSTPLEQRTKNHTPTHFQGAMRDWLESLLPEHPIAVVLETGINKQLRWRSGTRYESNGHGGTHGVLVRVWLSTIRETVWQKRMRRTLLNADEIESPEVAACLVNTRLPWQR